MAWHPHNPSGISNRCGGESSSITRPVAPIGSVCPEAPSGSVCPVVPIGSVCPVAPIGSVCPVAPFGSGCPVACLPTTTDPLRKVLQAYANDSLL